MKKYIILLPLSIILLALTACEMAPADRMGIIEMEIAASGNSRDISGTTQIIVIAYPSFEDGLDTYLDLEYADVLSSIIENPETNSLMIDLTSDNMVTTMQLDPGTWTFIILSYMSPLGDLYEISPWSCYSQKIIKERSIFSGYNFIDAELTLNMQG
ncbi:MAG: hypothetical protein JXA95_13370 [Spirochaetales bacterium]|nr:hypothetical protein [Spirochaetales bacterium]